MSLDSESLLDNAATASQHLPLLENGVVREAVVLNIVNPLRERIAELEAAITDALEYGGVHGTATEFLRKALEKGE